MRELCKMTCEKNNTFEKKVEKIIVLLAHAYQSDTKDLGLTVEPLSMDNFRKGLHSHLGASAKTSLAVCLTELKH